MIEFEVPTPWLIYQPQAHHYRSYCASVMVAAATLRQTLSLRSVPYHSDLAPRSASPGGILISYHSVGEAPNVWRVKETPIVRYFSFDRLGYSGWSEIATSHLLHAEANAFDQQIAEDLVDSLAAELSEGNRSKYLQPERSPTEWRDHVFLPLQTTEDRVQSLHRLNQLQVLAAAARAAEGSKRHLVVKRHPLCSDPRVEAALAAACDSSAYVHTSEASIHDLLPRCHAVLVGNSGVGLEALVHRRPVFSFGLSEYAAGVQLIREVSEIEDVFSGDASFDHGRATRFLGYFLSSYCFDVNTPDTLISKLAAVLKSAGLPPENGEIHDAAEAQLASYAQMENRRREAILSG